MGYRVVALSSGEGKRDLAMKLGAHDYLDGSAVDQAAELQKMGGAKVILGEFLSSLLLPIELMRMDDSDCTQW